MNIRIIFASALIFAPLSAQGWEVGIFAGNQSYNSLSDSGGSGSSAHGSATRQSALGIRLGYSVMDLGPAWLQLTVGYQPTVTSTVRIISSGTSVANQSPTDSGPLDYKTSHSALGIMVFPKTIFDLALGMELRYENQSLLSNNATYLLPWFRANLGIAFPSPVLKPFIRLEIAGTPFSGGSKEQVKALAPKFQFGVYGGILF